MFSYEIFRYCVTKSFWRRTWYPPCLMHKIFRYPKFSDTPKCSPTKFFGTVWQKVFDGERDTPPVWCIKFFDTRNFLIHRSVPQRNFSVLCDKKFLTENVIPPSLMHKIFRYPKFSDTPKCSPTKFFGTVWQKVFDGERDTPPLWCIKFFDTRNFLIHRSVPQRNFSVLWDKNFFDKTVNLPPPSLENFRYQNSFETPKCSPTKFFGTVSQKVFDGERDTPPLWCIKFFDTRNFLIHRSVPRRNFSVLCDKKFLTENVIPPSPMHKIFRYPKFFDTPKCSPTKFIGTVRQKILNEKSWYPLFSIKYRNQWWNWCL